MCVYIYISHIFIHSSVDGHLGCFLILAIVSSATRNIGVHLSFQISLFVSSGYIPRSGIPGSYGSSIFSFLRNGDLLSEEDKIERISRLVAMVR